MNNDFYVPPILFPLLDLQEKKDIYDVAIVTENVVKDFILCYILVLFCK